MTATANAAAPSTPALPDSSQLQAALQPLAGPSAAASLTGDVTRLAASPSTANLTLVDQAINAIVGSTAIALPSRTDAPGPSLATTLSGLGALEPAQATSAQQQALAELRATLTTAGLSALLASATNASPTAVSELAIVQKLAPDADVPAGDLSAVATIVAQLAGAVAPASGDASTLNAVAASLTGAAALTPAQLQAAVSGLASVTSTAASPAGGVTVAQLAGALASQLSQAGPLFGGLAGVGAPLSALSDPTDLGTALAQITGLSSAPPGSSQSLTELSTVLVQIAGTPGVSSAAASAIDSAASTLASGAGVGAPALLGAVGQLAAVATGGVPNPLSGLLSALTGELSASSAIFGTIPGLSSASQSLAVTELSSLAGLGPANTIPALPGIAAVLSRVTTDVPAADPLDAQALEDLVQAFSIDPLTPDELAGGADALVYIAQTLPAPQSATISGLAGELSNDATAMDGVATAADPQAQPAAASTTARGATPITRVERSPPAAPRLLRVSHSGDRLTLRLACPASDSSGCDLRIRASQAGHRPASRNIAVRPGQSTRLTLLLPRLGASEHAAGHPAQRTATGAIRLILSSGSHRTVRILR